MRVRSSFPALFSSVAAFVVVAGSPLVAHATDITGTVSFEGAVQFVQPIPGIDFTDLVVTSGPGIEATGNGEQCDIVSDGSASVDGLGAYPGAGTLSVQLTIGRGGGNPPDGTCLLQLRASGNDGADVSAGGTVTVEVTVANISGNETVAVADPILVRPSKTHAGLSKDCQKWVKKEIKFKGKCNFLLWKLGGADGSLKCKNAGEEVLDCDDNDYVDQVVQFSFDEMNQQVDAPNADAIDLDVLKEQAKCQKFLGKAAVNFFTQRNKFVQKRCVDALDDTDACRAQAGQDALRKLSLIDKCFTTQGTDVMTGLTIADVDEPCDSQCITAGEIDRKCMKDCFEFELTTLADGLMGDVPDCGNGILQGAEACDDGNVADGDCCSATCTAEPAGEQTCGVGACENTVAQCSAGEPVVCTPLPAGDEGANCADGIDNDCDTLVDGADPDCP